MLRAMAAGALVGFGIAAAAVGWDYGTRTRLPVKTEIAAGTLMFPHFAAKLATAAQIEITHRGIRTIIEKRPDGHWGIAGMRDYPVRDAKVHALLTELTELRLVEARTSDPAQFARLGLDDPNAVNSSADLLRVMDDNGTPILATIVGHRRVRTGTAVPGDALRDVYVRRPQDHQSWLAKGGLQVDPDPAQWLDRSLMNIVRTRISSVNIDDGKLVFERVDGRFGAIQPVNRPKLKGYKVDGVARALELLTFREMKPDTGAPGIDARHVVFSTNDGLVVTVTVRHADQDVWARFAVSGSNEAKTEADRLNARLAGWTYLIDSWKERSLFPDIDVMGLVEPEPKAGRQ